MTVQVFQDGGWWSALLEGPAPAGTACGVRSASDGVDQSLGSASVDDLHSNVHRTGG
eukprot:CAMPEP_0174753916 /NCGR_PEP_ID=MMETSP1094-20130205/104960_1 /TAXON_ID=156173 /ORGANISM="Chrysochromulina brevifilum, Strain UTEX LB 985" /LENGTH=56 /DNA_ID=CAMNT_0015959739 /DNA_START=44 /DNA_END=210 /DNA_ORIENTATION=-